MSSQLTEAEQERLEDFFSKSAARLGNLDFEYWIENDLDGSEPDVWKVEEVTGDYDSFCWECAQLVLARLQQMYPGEEFVIRGGFGLEGDSTPYCGVCCAWLENFLTDYGCESELECFLGWGFDASSVDDCHSMQCVLASMGWRTPEGREACERDYQYRNRIQRYKDLHRLGRHILSHLEGEWDDLFDDLRRSHTPG